MYSQKQNDNKAVEEYVKSVQEWLEQNTSATTEEYQAKKAECEARFAELLPAMPQENTSSGKPTPAMSDPHIEEVD